MTTDASTGVKTRTTRHGAGKRWRARHTGPDGRERSQHFERKLDAQRWLDDQAGKVAAGGWTAPERGRVTLGQWSAGWLSGQHHLRPSTRARYAGLLRVHIVPVWGPVALSDVAHADVAAWAAKLSAAGLSPSTVRQAHRVLALVLALAVRDGRIPRNPADGMRLPRARRAEPAFLDREQVEALAAEMGEEGDVVRFLALSGLRFGEAAALTVRRVDLLRRRVEVAESVTEVQGRLEWGAPRPTSAAPCPWRRP